MRKILERNYNGFINSNLLIILRIGAIAAILYYFYNYWRLFVEYTVWQMTPAPENFSRYAPYFILLGTLIGVLLYWLRSSARVSYGVVEILFGVVAISFSATTMTLETYQTGLLQIAAGVYIVVRGLDNLKQGLDQAPKHLLWFGWDFALRLPYRPIDFWTTMYVVKRPALVRDMRWSVHEHYLIQRRQRFARRREWRRFGRILRGSVSGPYIPFSRPNVRRYLMLPHRYPHGLNGSPRFSRFVQEEFERQATADHRAGHSKPL